MNRLFFGILYGLSLLPLQFLYCFSDFLFFIMNYLIGYRRKVIEENLKNSFPEKSPKEIKKIRSDFYKNFADYLIETLKIFSISKEELDKLHTYSNLEVFEECKSERKDTILMAGHMFNWEWFVGLGPHLLTENNYAVYHKVRNDFWNDQINGIRGKFGAIPLDMKKAPRQMMGTKNNGTNAYLFIADQSPKQSALHHSLKFLNQETPVFVGYDKIAMKKDMAIVYCKMVKIKRGHYHTTFERILPENDEFEPMEIVNKFFQNLEETIKKDPSNWLWSHKRWKYKKGIHY